MLSDSRAGTASRTPVILSWSGGKDSALALHEQARRFVREGFAARLVCVDTQQLDRTGASALRDGRFMFCDLEC